MEHEPTERSDRVAFSSGVGHGFTPTDVSDSWGAVTHPSDAHLYV